MSTVQSIEELTGRNVGQLKDIFLWTYIMHGKQ